MLYVSTHDTNPFDRYCTFSLSIHHIHRWHSIWFCFIDYCQYCSSEWRRMYFSLSCWLHLLGIQSHRENWCATVIATFPFPSLTIQSRGILIPNVFNLFTLHWWNLLCICAAVAQFEELKLAQGLIPIDLLVELFQHSELCKAYVSFIRFIFCIVCSLFFFIAECLRVDNL